MQNHAGFHHLSFKSLLNHVNTQKWLDKHLNWKIHVITRNFPKITCIFLVNTRYGEHVVRKYNRNPDSGCIVCKSASSSRSSDRASLRLWQMSSFIIVPRADCVVTPIYWYMLAWARQTKQTLQKIQIRSAEGVTRTVYAIAEDQQDLERRIWAFVVWDVTTFGSCSNKVLNKQQVRKHIQSVLQNSTGKCDLWGMSWAWQQCIVLFTRKVDAPSNMFG